MTRNLVVNAGLAMAIVLTAGTLQAQQSNLLADLYGRGVHAYYNGKFEAAHKFLSDAIEQKTDDPRCYYFRGVTYMQMGRPEQATKDFQTGALLEAQDIQQVYPVSRSLQRIQGKVRLMIETHRKEGQLALRKYQQERRRVRYESLKEAEQDVLRGAPRATPTDTPEPPDNTDRNTNNPFSAPTSVLDIADNATPTKQKRITKSPVAAKQPQPAPSNVTTSAPAAAQPAVANPFGGGAPAAANPFGGAAPAAKPAAANPFGGGAPAAKPAAANPFGGGAPAAKPAAGNPFGGAAPAAKPAAANPFGGAAPAAKPAAANPFGGAAPAAKPAAAAGQKKGGAFGALFRAVSKSIPGGGAGDKAAVDPKEKKVDDPVTNPFGDNPKE